MRHHECVLIALKGVPHARPFQIGVCRPHRLVAHPVSRFLDAPQTRAGLGVVNPTGPWPRDTRGDEVYDLLFGFAALCANVYLAISAAKGRSVGKALVGLRLVVTDRPGKPGLARGLVRSSLQAGPWMEALMVWTGARDAIAGTRIVADEQGAIEHDVRESEIPNGRSQVATWKVAVAVALAIALHLFSAFLYMLVAAM